MRPSVRAEKYIRDARGWRKDVTDGNDNGTDGQTDGQTDRVRRNMRPPPREEGRIISVNYFAEFTYELLPGRSPSYIGRPYNIEICHDLQV